MQPQLWVGVSVLVKGVVISSPAPFCHAENPCDLWWLLRIYTIYTTFQHKGPQSGFIDKWHNKWYFVPKRLTIQIEEE